MPQSLTLPRELLQILPALPRQHRKALMMHAYDLLQPLRQLLSRAQKLGRSLQGVLVVLLKIELVVNTVETVYLVAELVHSHEGLVKLTCGLEIAQVEHV